MGGSPDPIYQYRRAVYSNQAASFSVGSHCKSRFDVDFYPVPTRAHRTGTTRKVALIRTIETIATTHILVMIG